MGRGKSIDMTGWVMKEHGVPDSLLTVIEKAYSKNNSLYWKCQCECGNIKNIQSTALRSGKTKSCGCLKTYKLSNNLKGKRFGRLIALEPTEKRQAGSIIWKCLCDCGNISYVSCKTLVAGQILSCGCLATETRSYDLKNQRFGKLLAIQNLGYDKNKKGNLWLCKCDCGNFHKTTARNLIRGDTKSCGCLTSFGEETIRKILTSNNIIFSTQKIYFDLISENGNFLRYDFYVNNEFLLEYDGEQHYMERNNSNDTLEERQARDKIKNEYAKSHNIPLKRIPYWDFDKITLENIMSDKWLINN